MKSRIVAGLLLGTVMVLTACGSAGGNGDGNGNGDGGGGGGAGLSGTLIGDGNAYVQSFDLGTDADWVRRISHGGSYDVVAVNVPAREIYVAGLNFLDPMNVTVYDMDTFGTKREWLWPDTSELGRVDGLAISPDGVHAAALLRNLGDSFLEILNMETMEVVATGIQGVTSTDMIWVSDTQLLMALDLQAQPVEFHGGIVVADFSDAMRGDEGIEMHVVVGFQQAQWGSAGNVHGFALSNDGEQLVFSRSGDIWIKDGLYSANTPHQLTTGPEFLTGAMFSPDDSLIAFVEYNSYAPERTFVMPNHRGDPVQIAPDAADGRRALLSGNNLVDRILVWLH